MPKVKTISFVNDQVVATLRDGRVIILPLDNFPRLKHGSAQERAHWELIGSGIGVHWPDLDEDISAQNFVDRRSSGESQRSYQRWLESRATSSQTA